MLRKKSLLFILSLGVILSAMAFTGLDKLTTAENVSKPTVLAYYFHYVGPPNPYFYSEYEDPANYVILGENEELECEEGNDALCYILCERRWDGFAWKPDFTDTLPGNIHDQLFFYWVYHVRGTRLGVKAL